MSHKTISSISKANPDKIEDLNVRYNSYMLSYRKTSLRPGINSLGYNYSVLKKTFLECY